MHSNRHVAPKVQRNLVRSRATAKQLSCTRTHTLLCGHCVLFCTRGGWLAATGAMNNPRARKKAKTSAERRLETLQGCHTNKFADIDFSKFQLRRAAAGDPMQVVPVKARSDALVQDWRDVGSYEPSGAPGYTTEQFMALCDDSTLRQHYTGPFGCKVQMSMPEPGGALCKAGKLVQGRSALQKLQKQLGVMCLRNIMGHFLGKDSAAISTEELQDANTAAHAVGGAGAMLTADEAAAWAPPAYPLFGDGLLLGGTLARQKQTLDSRTLELLRGEGAVVDKLSSGASGGAAFLAAFDVLRQVINGTTCVTQLTEGDDLLAHIGALGLDVGKKVDRLASGTVLLEQRCTINELSLSNLQGIVGTAAKLAGVDRRTMSPSSREARDNEARERLGIPSLGDVEARLKCFVEALKQSNKRTGKTIVADAARTALQLQPASSQGSAGADGPPVEQIVRAILQTGIVTQV